MRSLITCSTRYSNSDLFERVRRWPPPASSPALLPMPLRIVPRQADFVPLHTPARSVNAGSATGEGVF